MAGIYSFFDDTNAEPKDVVEKPLESSDDQAVPSPSISGQLDTGQDHAGLDEIFLRQQLQQRHQQRHDRQVPDQPEQPPVQVSTSSSSSDSDSVRLNSTRLSNTVRYCEHYYNGMYITLL